MFTPAFGQHGPYATQRGYDILAQAISGYMSITGSPEHPPTRSGQSISDYYAGMLCAFSIVSALHYRHRTGIGQRIDMALLDSLVIALDNLGERYTVGGEILTRAGNVSFGGSATGIYPTTDGHVAVAAAASNAVWGRFCTIIGREDLCGDGCQVRGRGQEAEGLRQQLAAAQAEHDLLSARTQELEGRSAAHVDHVTDDLAGFLGRLSTLSPRRPGEGRDP